MPDMEFLSTNINDALSLHEDDFVDQYENIDFLSGLLLSDKTLSIDDKLRIATLCADLCEKFHSYFHFEQSYFHLYLGKLYLERGLQSNAMKEFEHSVFQDPLNCSTIQLLMKSGDRSEVQKYQAHCAAHNIKVDGDERLYSRGFENFTDFLEFALSRRLNRAPNRDSYWNSYARYTESLDIVDIIETRNLITKSHALYHNNAARIYYNRHLIFKKLSNIDLAKNDLVKSRNLDPILLSCPIYYETKTTDWETL